MVLEQLGVYCPVWVLAVVCPWTRNGVWSSAEKLHAYAPLAASAISCGVRKGGGKMKRLSKDQKQQRADLVTRLNDAADAVRAALAAVNAEIAGKLNSAIENYNLVVSVVEAFRDEIVSEMEHYASDRSDRWQKSERGQRHEAWKQEWEGLEVTALDAIDAIDEPEMAHANELECLRAMN